MSESLGIFYNFFKSNKHLLKKGDRNWQTERIFFQLAFEHAKDSPLTKQAEEFQNKNRVKWNYLEHINRKEYYKKPVNYKTISVDGDSIDGIYLLDNKRVLSWSKDSSLRLFNLKDDTIEILDTKIKCFIRLGDNQALSLGVFSANQEIINEFKQKINVIKKYIDNFDELVNCKTENGQSAIKMTLKDSFSLGLCPNPKNCSIDFNHGFFTLDNFNLQLERLISEKDMETINLFGERSYSWKLWDLKEFTFKVLREDLLSGDQKGTEIWNPIIEESKRPYSHYIDSNLIFMTHRNKNAFVLFNTNHLIFSTFKIPSEQMSDYRSIHDVCFARSDYIILLVEGKNSSAKHDSTLDKFCKKIFIFSLAIEDFLHFNSPSDSFGGICLLNEDQFLCWSSAEDGSLWICNIKKTTFKLVAKFGYQIISIVLFNQSVAFLILSSGSFFLSIEDGWKIKESSFLIKYSPIYGNNLGVCKEEDGYTGEPLGSGNFDSKCTQFLKTYLIDDDLFLMLQNNGSLSIFDINRKTDVFRGDFLHNLAGFRLSDKYKLILFSYDGPIQVLDLEEIISSYKKGGKEVFECKETQIYSGSTQGAVNNFYFFDKNKAITCSDDGNLRFWNLNNVCFKQKQHDIHRIKSLDLFNDEYISISNDGNIRIWDENTGLSNIVRDTKLGFKYAAIDLSDVPFKILNGASSDMCSIQPYAEPPICFLEDKKIISCDYNLLRIWNLKNGESTVMGLIADWSGHSDKVTDIQLITTRSQEDYFQSSPHKLPSSNGQVLLLSCSNDTTLRLWDLEPVCSLSESKEYEFVDEQGVLREGVYDVERFSSKVFEGHSLPVKGIKVLNDMQAVSWSDSSYIDGKIKYDPIILWDLKSGRHINLEGHKCGVIGVTLINDNILSWAKDNSLRLWNLNEKTSIVFEGHTDIVSGVCIVNKDKFISWCNSDTFFGCSHDYNIRLWSIKNHRSKVFKGHTHKISGVKLFHKNHFFSWSQDSSVRLWSLKDGSSRLFQGHSDSILGICPIDEVRFFSWADDGVLILWDIEESKILMKYIFPGIDRLIRTRDENRFLCFSKIGECRVLKMNL